MSTILDMVKEQFPIAKNWDTSTDVNAKLDFLFTEYIRTLAMNQMLNTHIYSLAEKLATFCGGITANEILFDNQRWIDVPKEKH